MKSIKIMGNFICFLLVMAFLSCSKDEDDTCNSKYREQPSPDQVGTVIDGGELSETSLQINCLGLNPETNTIVSSSSYPFLAPFNDYSTMVFPFYLVRKEETALTELLSSLNESEVIQIGNLYREHNKERVAFLIDAYFNKYTTIQYNQSWPFFCTAYINGDVSVICDKTLFGEAPGSNLARHFSFESYPCMMVGIDEPILVYGFDDELPTDADGVFPQGAWLKAAYSMRFRDIPSEKYDDITFTLSIPVIREHCRKYIVYQYMGKELESKYSECTITGACHLQFDWK